MKRHAYLILAHKNFGQLRKLIMLLDDPRNDIFVHVDRKAAFRQKDWDCVCMHSRLVFTEHRLKVSWGGVSIMRAELLLLETAASAGQYDYYHLLSGMDLPIKDQDTIHAYFDGLQGRELINFWEMKADTCDRFHYYTLFPEGARNFLTHFLNDLFKKMQKAVGHRINTGVEFKSASQWFSITDDLARYVVSKKDWLEKVFRHTCLCDEIFLATLVWNSPFKDRVSHEDMRLIDWNRGGSIRHPWTFRIEDWDMLISSPCFWARKFDEGTDSAIISKVFSRLYKDTSRRLFLLAAYDRNSQVGPALTRYAEALSRHGDVIAVMDNECSESQLERLTPYTVHTEAHRHEEYDFGSYKRAFNWAKSHLRLEDYTHLYLVNDSVYGPLRPLGDYLGRMEGNRDCGASAMVLNPHRQAPHLQSWFICLHKEVFTSQWFADFLASVKKLGSKEDVCVEYETGLTGLLSSHGIRYSALWTLKGKSIYNKVLKAYRKGLPFIKKNAFTRHSGSLGRQIRLILNDVSPDIRETIVEDAGRTIGEQQTARLLKGGPLRMAARYICYLKGKLI